MSAQPWVLRVMEANAKVCAEYLHPEYATDIRNVSTAVAELIAAVIDERVTRAAALQEAELLRKGKIHPEELHPGNDAPDGISTTQRHMRAYQRVSAALAAVTKEQR